MKNLYTKPSSKLLRTNIYKNESNLQIINTDNISLVQRNIYNTRRKMMPPLQKVMEELQMEELQYLSNNNLFNIHKVRIFSYFKVVQITQYFIFSFMWSKLHIYLIFFSCFLCTINTSIYVRRRYEFGNILLV